MAVATRAAMQTVKVAVINIGLTSVLVYKIGTIGAAIATLVAYFAYYFMVKKQVELIEPKVVKNSNKISPLIIAVVAVIIAIQLVFNQLIY